jgi:acetoin utilization deacetylase AcuC-like enzyme
MATGFVWHERYMWHDTGRQAGPFDADAAGWMEALGHSESPDTKRRLRNLLDVSGLLDQLVRIDPRPATLEELHRFHTERYVTSVRERSADMGGDAGDGATPFGKGSYEVALLSAGGVIAAVDAVLDGRVDNAYALVRPPGHHALPDEGKGFCLFGNAAIAIHHLRQVRGLDRVAILDWDVHHGNGTEAAFYDDPSVLTMSIHQDNYFPPDSGKLEHNGEGAGEGYNINIPLPAGSGNGAYQAVLERVVVPALERFRPDFVIVASGFDASALDPLGRMMVTAAGYGELTRIMMEAAERLCGGRLVLEHEGGYSAELVPFCGLHAIETLSGIPTEARETPLQMLPEGFAGQDLQPHQEARIEEVARLVEKIAAAPAAA